MITHEIYLVSAVIVARAHNARAYIENFMITIFDRFLRSFMLSKDMRKFQYLLFDVKVLYSYSIQYSIPTD